jgi:hypothetical protein
MEPSSGDTEESRRFHAVVRALEQLMKDPAFVSTRDSFARVGAASRTAFEAYVEASRTKMETHLRAAAVDYDADAFAASLERRKRTSPETLHGEVFAFLDVLRRGEPPDEDDEDDERGRALPKNQPAWCLGFGSREVTLEEHRANEREIDLETEDGDERPDLNDLLVVTKA